MDTRKNSKQEPRPIDSRNNSMQDDGSSMEAERLQEVKGVGWLEVLFDMVYAACLARTTKLLEHVVVLGTPASEALCMGVVVNEARGFGQGIFGISETMTLVLAFLLYSMSFWVTWSHAAFYCSQFSGGDDIVGRVLWVLMLSSVVGMASTVQGGFRAHTSLRFCQAFATTRLWMLCLLLRAVWQNKHPLFRKLFFPTVLGHALEVLLLFGSSFFVNRSGDVEVRVILILASMIVCWLFSIPYSAQRFYTVPVSDTHMPKRFALLTLLALGFGFVALMEPASLASDHDNEAARLAGVSFAGLALLMFWWTYFDSFEARITFTRASLSFFSIFHFVLISGVLAVAAAFKLALLDWACSFPHAATKHPLPKRAQWAVCVSLSIALIGSGALRAMALLRRKHRRSGVAAAARVGVFFVMAPLLLLTSLSLCLLPVLWDWPAFWLFLVVFLLALLAIVMDMCITRVYSSPPGQQLQNPLLSHADFESYDDDGLDGLASEQGSTGCPSPEYQED